MQSVILLAVLGVWIGVIIPPVMRSRVESRPNSSVSDFRRQLSTLQRAVPTRGMGPMRGMARPLAPSAGSRTAARRGAGAPGRRAHADSRRHEGGRHGAGRRPQMPQISAREMQRRRRANVLFVLVISTAITGFLAATTKSSTMIWAFGLSFVGLCGYCYKLVQIRSLEIDRTYGERNWFNAA